MLTLSLTCFFAGCALETVAYALGGVSPNQSWKALLTRRWGLKGLARYIQFVAWAFFAAAIVCLLV